jgi:hypothetical protein
LSADGLIESTDYMVDWQPFAGSFSDSVGPITRTFQGENGGVSWDNDNFENGTAVFYRVPRTQANNAMIIAWFRGSVSPDWGILAMTASSQYLTTCRDESEANLISLNSRVVCLSSIQ